MQQVIPTALFLLSQLATPPADQQQQILNQVLQLRNLSKQINRVVGGEQNFSTIL
jgi:coenzyme F420-reducing hydrogenase alpha subunit